MTHDLIRTERVPGLTSLLIGVDLTGGLKNEMRWGWLGWYRFAIAVGGRGIYVRLLPSLEGRCLTCEPDKQGRLRLLCRKKGTVARAVTFTVEGKSRTEILWTCPDHAAVREPGDPSESC